jgi:hypothetical protein
MRYFSPSTKGFYGEEHGSNKPSDCVAITEQEYNAVASFDAVTQTLSANENGKPILVSKLDDRNYTVKRKSEYLSIEEQLDMQYWDKVNGTTTWQDHINEIKTNNPKPTE